MQGGNFSIYRVRSHAEDIAVESTFGLYHRLIIAGNAAWRTWVTVTQKSQSAPVTFAPADPYLDKYLASNKSSTQLSHAYINTPQHTLLVPSNPPSSLYPSALFNMHLSTTTLTALALALLPLASAADCQNSPGVANGQCVKFYGGNGECKGNPLGSYKPDCTGSCFQYNSFGSLKVAGDGTYGTLFLVLAWNGIDENVH
jgi:hypothetical protein